MIKPLPEETIRERSIVLSETLRDLARIESNVLIASHLSDFAARFEYVYSDGYRQLYSELYPIILGIRAEDPENLDNLGDNLENVKVYLADAMDSGEYGYSPELYGCVLKLSDHINLEILRLVESEKARKELEKLDKRAERTKEALDEVDEKIHKVQTELVLILSIFASIIMLFSGSISVLGNSISVLGNPHDVHELAMVVIVCGIILVDAISLLMGYIHRMIKDLHPEKTRKMISENLKVNSPILMFNILMLAFLVIDIILWIC